MNNIFTLYIDNEQNSANRLTVNSCGINTNETDIDCRVNRPNGRQDYLFGLLVKGDMELTTDTFRGTLHAGDAFLWFPNQPQHHAMVDNHPFEWRWIHFSGTEVMDVLAQLSLTDRTPLHLTDTAEIECLHTAMMSEFKNQNPYYQQIMDGQLQMFLGTVARVLRNADIHTHGSWMSSLEDSRKEIYWRFASAIKVEDLAKNCNLSLSRYLYLFKRQYGVSPHQYQLMLRIEKAKSLLHSTDLTIRQIGERVGFSDTSYFARLFKKHTGHTPTEYRQ